MLRHEGNVVSNQQLGTLSNYQHVARFSKHDDKNSIEQFQRPFSTVKLKVFDFLRQVLHLGRKASPNRGAAVAPAVRKSLVHMLRTG